MVFSGMSILFVACSLALISPSRSVDEKTRGGGGGGGGGGEGGGRGSHA